MLFTELGMLMEVKPLQSENTYSPMLVTELGILIETKPLQPENAE